MATTEGYCRQYWQVQSRLLPSAADLGALASPRYKQHVSFFRLKLWQKKCVTALIFVDVEKDELHVTSGQSYTRAQVFTETLDGHQHRSRRAQLTRNRLTLMCTTTDQRIERPKAPRRSRLAMCRKRLRDQIISGILLHF